MMSFKHLLFKLDLRTYRSGPIIPLILLGNTVSATTGIIRRREYSG